MNPKERRMKVLEHIGRYRLTLREVVSQLFLDGQDPTNILRKLVEEGVITANNRKSGGHLAGGQSYYQLTREGARQTGLPVSRSKSLENRIPQYLSFLSFCCRTKKRRELMEPNQVTELFPQIEDVRNEFYAVEKGKRGPQFYRLFYVGTGGVNYQLKRLSEALKKAAQIRELEILLSAGLFRPTLLLEEPGQSQQFEQLIKKSSIIPKRHRKAIGLIVVPSITS